MKLYVFDLDGVVTISKQKITKRMASVLDLLVKDKHVAIISGASKKQFQTQVAPYISNKIILIPTCGCEAPIPLEDVASIIEIVEEVSKELGYWEEKTHGCPFENRLTQLTYSALGQEAPIEEKERWDTPPMKRTEMIVLINNRLKEDYEARIGGTTSIDVTFKEMNKASGVFNLMKQLGIEKENVFFFGDSFEEWGNDYPVLSLGVNIVKVENPQETIIVLGKQR